MGPVYAGLLKSCCQAAFAGIRGQQAAHGSVSICKTNKDKSSPHVHSMQQSLAPAAVISGPALQAWAAGSAYVADTLPQKALDALEALAPPDWPPAVCATAAAIVAAAAQVMAATALRDEVSLDVWVQRLTSMLSLAYLEGADPARLLLLFVSSLLLLQSADCA